MRKTLRNKFRSLYNYCLPAILAFSCTGALAQNKNNVRITLKNATVNTTANAVQWLDSFSIAHPSSPVQVVIQFSNMPSAEERTVLNTQGISVLDYVGNNAFLAIIGNKINRTGINAANMSAIAVMQAAWKIDAAVKEMTAGAKGNTNILVSAYEHIDMQAFREYIAAAHGTITDKNYERFHAYKISIPVKQLNSLARWYGIKYIGVAPEPVPLNFESRNATKANLASQPVSLGGFGLTGEGVTVGVGDNISGMYHVDLRDRILNFHPWPYTNHGQHTNGTVGAAGTVDPKGEGYAPHVRLLDHVYDLILIETAAMFQTYNMTLTNNSYAAVVTNCSYAGTYDVLAQYLDDISRENPYTQHVFASGNDGNLACPPYATGFATVCGGYQPAKNIIVVGNMNKMLGLQGSSSKGPVKDGRIKPEICAIGKSVWSTKGIDTYQPGDGTSMACPNVTGALALLTERYKQVHGGANPKSDILKCLLVNGATDMGNAGPDFKYGFGIMNMGRTLQMHENNRYQVNNVANSGQQTFTINVPANTAQLKVMLYWNDTSASPLAANALVNDLDLEVTEPSATLHHPFVLDPTPANADNLAVEGVDHKNNIEQVLVNNPAAGTYTITVKGYSVITPTQSYVVAYDFLPLGMSFTYPVAGAAYPANDSLRVYWDASAGTNTFTLEFSADNGANWTIASSNIAADQRTYSFYTPNIGADKCRFRLTRNTTGSQITSEPFVVHPQSPLALDTAQCPGYLAMHWDAVPNATGYEVLRKKGFYLQPVDTVTATNYVFSGLSLDSTYYATIRPLINNLPGWRSIAVIRQPNTGNCSGSISDGDLMLQKIEGPNSGRKLTSTQRTASETVSVRVRNLDNVAAGNYKISWRLNNGAWQSQTFTTPIPANSSAVVSLGTVDLAAAGNYSITAAVQNMAITDPVHNNDTAVKYVRHLVNDPVNLNAGFAEDFEAGTDGLVMKDTMGILPNEHWDYTNSTDTGRLRFLTSSEINISGNRSANLDANIYIPGTNTNYLDGTFNLAAYDTATDEVRVEFDYKLHGKPKFKNGNEVWVRGSDMQPWVHAYYYDTSMNQGQVVNSGSISLTTALAQNAQNFSSAFQVRFGQNDTSVIAANDYGNGLTIDNVKLYTVKNDVALLKIENPATIGCSLGSNVPLTVQVYNNFNQPQNNVQLYYQFDGGSVVNETIANIAAKDTIDYTFTVPLNLSATGIHTINTWLVSAGDTYQNNDSIMNYAVRNQPLITQFPYLENFENSNGAWYPAGTGSSWAYGTPASLRVRKAASGIKAWKTNLTGYYNNGERSFLYSPCFDIFGLNNPMLSFSTAMDIENCGGNICDAAFIEYSTDDSVWTKLGAPGQGTNWYDTTGAWTTQDFVRWHVASISLPKLTKPVRFRFVMTADAGTGREGVAIDDIHIFDRVYGAYDGGNAGPVTQSAGGNQWIDFIQGGKLMAQLQPNNQSLGNTGVSGYVHPQMYDRKSSQYFLPRNFVINPAAQPADSVTTRLYITDADVVAMVNATGCNECSAATDAYALGVTKYHDPVASVENGSLEDNVNGVYTYIPARNVKWVPYDNGYYAEVKLGSFSELWFNDGAPIGTNVLTIPPVVFNAKKISEQHVLADWTSAIDTFVQHYELQRSPDSNNFSTIYTVNALHQLTSAYYSYTDTPNVSVGSSVYYRVKYTLNNGSSYFTYIRRVDWLPANQVIDIYPNPVTSHELTISWTAEPGTRMQASLIDILGRTVTNYSIPAGEWSNKTTLQVPPVSTGMYFIRVVIGDNHFEKKILVK